MNQDLWLCLPAFEAAPRAEPSPSLEARALGGDDAAWSALVARHNHRVVVSLLARGIALDVAKDLAQEAWVRLVEQARGGKLGDLKLPGLAVRQAGFLALEWMRRSTLASEPLDESVVDPSQDQEARLEETRRARCVREVLSSSSTSAQRVFQLLYDAGEARTPEQVASELGLSLQRVRQIVCEVRKKLRARWEGS